MSYSLKPNWINGFIGTCLEDIAMKYQNTMNRNNAINFNTECINKLKELYGDSYVKEIQKGLNFTFNTIWSEETFIWKMVYNVNDILQPIQQQEKKDNIIIELVNQLQKYGLYKNFDLNRVKKDNIMKNYDTEKLKKELEENQNAEKDAEKILKDEYVMKELVSNSNHIGYIVNRTNPDKAYSVNVTLAAKKILQPEIDHRIMERKIDAEARRRIYEQEKLQKELQEKQKFEDAVHKRINELRK